MADLPDPRSPLNQNEKNVFGANAIRHPVTGYPLQQGGHGSEFPAPPPNVQAREHLKLIAREHGADVASAVAAELAEFERNGGTVEMPAPHIPHGFARAFIKT